MNSGLLGLFGTFAYLGRDMALVLSSSKRKMLRLREMHLKWLSPAGAGYEARLCLLGFGFLALTPTV